jgi:hypothetical protein
MVAVKVIVGVFVMVGVCVWVAVLVRVAVGRGVGEKVCVGLGVLVGVKVTVGAGVFVSFIDSWFEQPEMMIMPKTITGYKNFKTPIFNCFAGLDDSILFRRPLILTPTRIFRLPMGNRSYQFINPSRLFLTFYSSYPRSEYPYLWFNWFIQQNSSRMVLNESRAS